MKLLVTGGAGYIGSHAVLQLIEAGHEVTVIDNFSSGNRWAVEAPARLVEGSVGDSALLERVFSETGFDAVFHFAAHIEVADSVTQPLRFYRNNVGSSLALFEAMVKADVKKLIFSSTAAVYGELGNEPVDETAPLAPVNPYGMTKVMTEAVLRDLVRAVSDFRYVTLRYFNVAGARLDARRGQATPRATHLVKVASGAALGKYELFINGKDYPTPDGTCLRDYIHAEDLAAAHLDALAYLVRGGESEIFNVGYGRPISNLEVVTTMKRVSGVDFPVRFGARRAGDPPAISARVDKIKRVLGWKPKYDDLDVICKTALEFERRLDGQRLKD